MTIDGTNISTFGLQLANFNDYWNQPARKEKKSAFFESKKAKINLVGQYDKTKIESFTTLMKTSVNHVFVISEFGYTITGAIPESIKINPDGGFVQIEFEIVA